MINRISPARTELLNENPLNQEDAMFEFMRTGHGNDFHFAKPGSGPSATYYTVMQRTEDNKKTHNRRRNRIAKASRKKNRRK